MTTTTATREGSKFFLVLLVAGLAVVLLVFLHPKPQVVQYRTGPNSENRFDEFIWDLHDKLGNPDIQDKLGHNWDRIRELERFKNSVLYEGRSDELAKELEDTLQAILDGEITSKEELEEIFQNIEETYPEAFPSDTEDISDFDE